jgi:5-methylthioadenosine/S-adenosylhomocysteine deaminase
MADDASVAKPGTFLIKGGALITVDPTIGTLPKGDVLIRDGQITDVGIDLADSTAEIIDASDMIVMPGFVDSHYHMWSTLGRNFLSDGGYEYYQAK